MSRIPASPHITNAPAPLPVASPTAPSQAAKQGPAEQAAATSAVSEGTAPADQVALEKRGGSMNHYNLGLDATTESETVTATDPVSDAELKWALNLEEKVVKGYQPTAQEFEKYADIAARLADCNPARQMEDNDVVEVKGPQISDAVSDAELKWALRLEERVVKGYQPSAEEVAAYEAIYTRMTAESVPDTPEKDLKWAQDLMKKVQQGYQPTAQEIKRYEAIYTEVQETLQSQQSTPTEADLQWAKGLQAKVGQGYQASEAEVKRYEEIYHQLQHAKSVEQVKQ